MGTIEIPKPSVASAEASGRFAWITENLGGHIREYGGTFATEFAVLACQLLTYKLAAHFLGKTGFSEYAVARRTISILYPVVLLGLGVGLPRYIADATGRGDEGLRARYFGATLWCVGLSALVCVVLLNSFPGRLAYLFFGSREYTSLILPLSLVVAGSALHAIVYSYFRGILNMRAANLLQFLSLGLVPLAVFTFYSQSVQALLTALGILTIVVAGLALPFTPLRAAAKNNRGQAKELLRFGIQRVPGDFILMALLALPVTFVAHLKGVQEAGFVAFGISVVSVIGSVFAPVGLVLLPKAATMFAEGSSKELREHLRTLLRFTFAVSVVMILAIWMWAPGIIRLYLGVGFEQVVPIVRLLVVGALPYSLYLVVRNLVDAYHRDGVIAAILFGGLAVFLVGCWIAKHFNGGGEAILGVFVLALSTLAVLSSWECRRILRG
jgi:O-antigen/teichoic acid export membrane protein